MTQSFSFADVEDSFADHETYRDIYALQTSRDEWRTLLDAVLDGRWRCELSINGEESTDTGRALDTLRSSNEWARLVVSLPGFHLNCLFSEESEIEFYLDPSEITVATFGDLLDFMSLMSEATDRNIIVADEGGPEYGIFGCEASSREFRQLVRPKNPTPLSRSIGARVCHLLEPFYRLALRHPNATADAPPDPRNAADGDASARLYRTDVYQPNQMDWHTGLREHEYRSLSNLHTAFELFFGDRTAEEICAIGGFKGSALRRQFWESFGRAWQVFACDYTLGQS